MRENNTVSTKNKKDRWNICRNSCYTTVLLTGIRLRLVPLSLSAIKISTKKKKKREIKLNRQFDPRDLSNSIYLKLTSMITRFSYYLSWLCNRLIKSSTCFSPGIIPTKFSNNVIQAVCPWILSVVLPLVLAFILTYIIHFCLSQKKKTTWFILWAVTVFSVVCLVVSHRGHS